MAGNRETAIKEKDFTLTFCQVISALAVMILHTNVCFWVFSATHPYWVSANVIESIFYFAVPVFFMITGITLADYKDSYSTKTFFKKRIGKTFVPYIVWSVLAVLFMLATGSLKTSDLTPDWLIRSLVRTDNIITYYWFFGALFVFYLLMPFIASIKRERKSIVFRYHIIVFFIGNVLIFFILRLYGVDPLLIDSIDIGLGNLIFIFLGYYIYKNPPALHTKIFIYILSALGLMVHMVGTYMLSMNTGHLDVLFKGYSNFPSILYSLGVFVMLRDIALKIREVERLRKIIEWLGQYTFAVFLLHWFIINITKLIILPNPVSLEYRLFFPVLLYAVIVLITWCLRKIPVIRKVVP